MGSKSFAYGLENASPLSASGVLGPALLTSSQFVGSTVGGNTLNLGTSSAKGSNPFYDAIGAQGQGGIISQVSGGSTAYVTDQSNRSVFVDNSRNTIPTISVNYGSPGAGITAPTVTGATNANDREPKFLELGWKEALAVAAIVLLFAFFRK